VRAGEQWRMHYAGRGLDHQTGSIASSYFICRTARKRQYGPRQVMALNIEISQRPIFTGWLSSAIYPIGTSKGLLTALCHEKTMRICLRKMESLGTRETYSYLAMLLRSLGPSRMLQGIKKSDVLYIWGLLQCGTHNARV
jgi:hypothetical protein